MVLIYAGENTYLCEGKEELAEILQKIKEEKSISECEKFLKESIPGTSLMLKGGILLQKIK